MVLKAAGLGRRKWGPGHGTGAGIGRTWCCFLGSLNRGPKSRLSLDVVPFWVGADGSEPQAAGVISVSPKHTKAFPLPISLLETFSHFFCFTGWAASTTILDSRPSAELLSDPDTAA